MKFLFGFGYYFWFWILFILFWGFWSLLALFWFWLWRYFNLISWIWIILNVCPNTVSQAINFLLFLLFFIYFVCFSSCMLLSWVHLGPSRLFQAKDTKAEITLLKELHVWFSKIHSNKHLSIYNTRSQVRCNLARWSVVLDKLCRFTQAKIG